MTTIVESSQTVIPANTVPMLAKFGPSVQGIVFEFKSAFIKILTSSVPGNVKLRIALVKNGAIVWQTISAGIASSTTASITLARGTIGVETSLGTTGNMDAVNYLDSFPDGIKLNSLTDYFQIDAPGILGQAYSVTFTSVFSYEYDECCY